MTSLEQLARDRVRNSTRAFFTHGVGTAQVGMAGAGVYALLEVARAIRAQGPDAKTERLLTISDALVDAITDEDARTIERIAEAYRIEREGIGVDQLIGLPKLGGIE